MDAPASDLSAGYARTLIERHLQSLLMVQNFAILTNYDNATESASRDTTDPQLAMLIHHVIAVSSASYVISQSKTIEGSDITLEYSLSCQSFMADLCAGLLVVRLLRGTQHKPRV